MKRAIRFFVLIEGLSFLTAALVHFGVLVRGYQHHPAGTAESVIGAVLLVGLVLSLRLPSATRVIGLAVQAFALLGTAVGIFTIVVGVGPRTIPDITYHAIIVVVLIAGLATAVRGKISSDQFNGIGAGGRS